MASRGQKKIASVIVTYNPNLTLLVSNISAICDEVSCTFVVDNSSSETGSHLKSRLESTFENLHVIVNNGNFGIGAAQNIGLRAAIKFGFDYAILLDQDTLMPPGSIKLLSDNLSLLLYSEKIAAIAPSYLDLHQRRPVLPNFIVRYSWVIERKSGSSGSIEIACAIASGLMINLASLPDIGMMNEDLFIDLVDTEWCFRCKLNGYKIYGMFDVVTKHTLGDKLIYVFGKEISIHSPLRHFYMVRNAISLSLYSATFDLGTKVRFFIDAIKHFIYFSIFTENKLSHFRYMCLGARDGFLNRLGKF